MEVKRKQSKPNFPQNEHFLHPGARTYTCAYQAERNVRFSKNLACFVLLPIFIINLMPYYRRINALFSASFIKSSYAKEKTGIHSLQRFTLAVLNFTK